MMRPSFTRREFLKCVTAGAMGLTGCGDILCEDARSAGRVSGAGSNRKPNVIFILTDDLGWAELGCYGNTFNETPNLDKLAQQGMRFTDAYASAPVCSPYRAALMTGQYPARVGITDYLRPNDQNHLSTEHTTIAELLKKAGYATGIVGKWHLSGYANHGAEEFPPSRHGFDETIVSENRGIGGGSYFHPYRFNREIQKHLPGREYLVDRCNLEAIDFIERHKDEPFFLYLSHYAVHTRLEGKPELVTHFESKAGAGSPREIGRTAAISRGKSQRGKRNNPHLAAQLKSIDEGVGKIMEKLAEFKLTEDTIVVFTGDNGGESNVTSNAPLRAGKSTLYEGGIRVTLIVRYPGFVPANTVCRTPTSNVDFYPTLCELIGIELDPRQAINGLSIAPLLRTPSSRLSRDALYWHYPLAKPHFLGGRSSGAIRQGRWKLIQFFDTGENELYNLADDIGESVNLARDYPEKLRELKTLLEAWRKDVGAKIPVGQSRI